METLKNYEDAINAGYHISKQSRYRGYVSRKVDIMSQPVQKGRFGLYVLLPAMDSTQYCWRVWLAK